MNSEKPGFFDRSENIKWMLRIFYAICALLVALDFVISRYSYYDIEALPGFYPVYGFVGCVLLVQVAKLIRHFLMRDEDYYERHADQDNSGDIS